MTQLADIVKAKSIGSSDIGAIMGLSPYKNPMDLYLEMQGLREREPADEPMLLGQILQRPLAEYFTLKTGIEHEWYDAPMIHPERAWMRGSPDGLIPDFPRRRHVLEIKTANLQHMREWSADEFAGEDGVPDYYAAQCHWLMSVTGCESCYLAAWIAGSNFRVYQLHAAADVEEVLVEAGFDFWRNTLNSVAPPIDGSKAAREYLRKRFPRETEPIRAAEDDELVLLWEYADLRRRMAIDDDRRDEIENRLIASFGEAEGVTWPHGKFTWKRIRDRQQVNWEGLALKMIDGFAEEVKRNFLDEYTETIHGYRKIHWVDKREVA